MSSSPTNYVESTAAELAEAYHEQKSDSSEKMDVLKNVDGLIQTYDDDEQYEYGNNDAVIISEEEDEELIPLSAYESSILTLLQSCNSLWHSNVDWAASHIINTVKSEESICEYLIAMEPRILEVSMEEVEDVASNGRDVYATCVHSMRDAESELSHYLETIKREKAMAAMDDASSSSMMDNASVDSKRTQKEVRMSSVISKSLNAVSGNAYDVLFQISIEALLHLAEDASEEDLLDILIKVWKAVDYSLFHTLELLWDAAEVDTALLNSYLLARHLFQEEDTKDADSNNENDGNDNDDSDEEDLVQMAKEQDKMILQRLNTDLDADFGSSNESLEPSRRVYTHLRRLFQRPVLTAIRKLQAYDWVRYMRRDHDWVMHLGPGHNLHNSKEMSEAVTKCDAFMYAQSLTILSPRGDDEEKRNSTRDDKREDLSLYRCLQFLDFMHALDACRERVHFDMHSYHRELERLDLAYKLDLEESGKVIFEDFSGGNSLKAKKFEEGQDPGVHIVSTSALDEGDPERIPIFDEGSDERKSAGTDRVVESREFITEIINSRSNTGVECLPNTSVTAEEDARGIAGLERDYDLAQAAEEGLTLEEAFFGRKQMMDVGDENEEMSSLMTSTVNKREGGSHPPAHSSTNNSKRASTAPLSRAEYTIVDDIRAYSSHPWLNRADSPAADVIFGMGEQDFADWKRGMMKKRRREIQEQRLLEYSREQKSRVGSARAVVGRFKAACTARLEELKQLEVDARESKRRQMDKEQQQIVAKMREADRQTILCDMVVKTMREVQEEVRQRMVDHRLDLVSIPSLQTDEKSFVADMIQSWDQFSDEDEDVKHDYEVASMIAYAPLQNMNGGRTADTETVAIQSGKLPPFIAPDPTNIAMYGKLAYMPEDSLLSEDINSYDQRADEPYHLHDLGLLGVEGYGSYWGASGPDLLAGTSSDSKGIRYNIATDSYASDIPLTHHNRSNPFPTSPGGSPGRPHTTGMASSSRSMLRTMASAGLLENSVSQASLDQSMSMTGQSVQSNQSEIHNMVHWTLSLNQSSTKEYVTRRGIKLVYHPRDTRPRIPVSGQPYEVTTKNINNVGYDPNADSLSNTFSAVRGEASLDMDGSFVSIPADPQSIDYDVMQIPGPINLNMLATAEQDTRDRLPELHSSIQASTIATQSTQELQQRLDETQRLENGEDAPTYTPMMERFVEEHRKSYFEKDPDDRSIDYQYVDNEDYDNEQPYFGSDESGDGDEEEEEDGDNFNDLDDSASARLYFDDTRPQEAKLTVDNVRALNQQLNRYDHDYWDTYEPNSDAEGTRFNDLSTVAKAIPPPRPVVYDYVPSKINVRPTPQTMSKVKLDKVFADMLVSKVYTNLHESTANPQTAPWLERLVIKARRQWATDGKGVVAARRGTRLKAVDGTVIMPDASRIRAHTGSTGFARKSPPNEEGEAQTIDAGATGGVPLLPHRRKLRLEFDDPADIVFAIRAQVFSPNDRERLREQYPGEEVREEKLQGLMKEGHFLNAVVYDDEVGRAFTQEPIEGTYVYDPPVGTVLAPGHHNISVTFIPALGLGNRYISAAFPNYCSIYVWKATPELTYEHRPEILVAGTPLDESYFRVTCSKMVHPSEYYTKKQLTEDKYKETRRRAMRISDQQARIQAVVLAKDRAAADTDLDTEDSESVYSYQGSEADAAEKLRTKTTVIREEERSPELDGEYIFSLEEGTILDRGKHHVAVQYRPTAEMAGLYNMAARKMHFIVGARAPRLAWDAIMDLTYLEPITHRHLKAKCLEPVPEKYAGNPREWKGWGTFTYDPPEGTYLDPGLHTLTAHFASADEETFRSHSVTTDITVHKVVSIIKWELPAPLYENVSVGPVQLNASTELPDPTIPWHGGGTFTYDPPLNTVLDIGEHDCTVTFEPTYPDKFLMAKKTHKLRVWKPLTPEIYWPPIDTMRYPAELTLLELGARVASLNCKGTLVYDPPMGAIVGAGIQPLTVHFKPEMTRWKPVSKTIEVEVLKAKPRLLWSQPSPLLEGKEIHAGILNCECVNIEDGSGTFTYDPPLHTVPDLGTHTIHCLYTPEGEHANNYETAELSVELRVREKPKKKTTIRWDTPPDIVHPSSLSSGLHCNAYCRETKGTYSYIPRIGSVLNAGKHTLIVKFKPTDEKHFLPCEHKVEITVTQGTSRLKWEVRQEDLRFGYGRPLDRSIMCASALSQIGTMVSGNLNYTINGKEVGYNQTLLDSGSHRIHCEFIPSIAENFTPCEGFVDLYVDRVVPDLEWDRIPTVVYPTFLNEEYHLNAKVATEHCTGKFRYSHRVGLALPVGIHQLKARFEPDDLVNFFGNDTATIFEVEKGYPSLMHWKMKSDEMVYGAKLDRGLHLTAMSDLHDYCEYHYDPPEGTRLPVGSHNLQCTIEVIGKDGPNYHTLTVSKVVHVKPMTPSLIFDQPESIVYGTPLTNMQLSARLDLQGLFAEDVEILGDYLYPSSTKETTNKEGYVYNPKAGTVLGAGEHKISVYFQPPPESINIGRSKKVSLKIKVEKCSPELKWDQLKSIPYGTFLEKGKQLNAYITSSNPLQKKGRITYRPEEGKVLAPGHYQLDATFHPDEKESMHEARASIGIDVKKGVPNLYWEEWPEDYKVFYGYKLREKDLSAVCTGYDGRDIDGTLKFTPGLDNVVGRPGEHTVTLEFFVKGRFADLYKNPDPIERTITVMKE